MFQLQDKADVFEVISAALAALGRSDTPYSYGAVPNPEGKGQILYFDLPRLSPLQFNIRTTGITTREQLIERIKRAITERLESD